MTGPVKSRREVLSGSAAALVASALPGAAGGAPKVLEAAVNADIDAVNPWRGSIPQFTDDYVSELSRRMHARGITPSADEIARSHEAVRRLMSGRLTPAEDKKS